MDKQELLLLSKAYGLKVSKKGGGYKRKDKLFQQLDRFHQSGGNNDTNSTKTYEETMFLKSTEDPKFECERIYGEKIKKF